MKNIWTRIAATLAVILTVGCGDIENTLTPELPEPGGETLCESPCSERIASSVGRLFNLSVRGNPHQVPDSALLTFYVPDPDSAYHIRVSGTRGVDLAPHGQPGDPTAGRFYQGALPHPYPHALKVEWWWHTWSHALKSHVVSADMLVTFEAAESDGVRLNTTDYGRGVKLFDLDDDEPLVRMSYTRN